MGATTSTILKTAQFGVIGLGVMGRNLALNIEDHGQASPCGTWNRSGWTRFVAQNTPSGGCSATEPLHEFVRSLSRPRRILMMIKAGEPVDSMMRRTVALARAGRHRDRRRQFLFQRHAAAAKRRCAARQLHFFGMGVSGGEEGARHGPSLMPGGDAEAYRTSRPCCRPLPPRAIPEPCVTHVGPDGSGHFVKMVHNGIEYGDMQLIAEAYDLLRKALGLASAGTGGHLRRMESRSAEVVPDRDHRQDLHCRRPADRQAAGRWSSTKPGRRAPASGPRRWRWIWACPFPPSPPPSMRACSPA